MTPYHLGLHIPLIIRLPGAKPLVSDALVSELDLLPTLFDLLGKSIRFTAAWQKPQTSSRSSNRRQPATTSSSPKSPAARSIKPRGMEERAVLDATHHLILRSRLDEPKVINADLRDMKPWINRIYGETVLRVKRVPRCLPHAANDGPACELGKATQPRHRPHRALRLSGMQNDPGQLHNLAADPLHGYNVEGQHDIDELNKSGQLDLEVRRIQASEEAKKKAEAETYGTVKLCATPMAMASWTRPSCGQIDCRRVTALRRRMAASSSPAHRTSSSSKTAMATTMPT
jgi:hypothetical protein